MATKEYTVNGHVFEVRERTSAIEADASRNLKEKLNIKINAESAKHENILHLAELSRLLLVKWKKPDGSEPLVGLPPAETRKYLMDHDGALLAIMKLSGKLANEANEEYEIDSGN